MRYVRLNKDLPIAEDGFNVKVHRKNDVVPCSDDIADAILRGDDGEELNAAEVKKIEAEKRKAEEAERKEAERIKAEQEEAARKEAERIKAEQEEAAKLQTKNQGAAPENK